MASKRANLFLKGYFVQFCFAIIKVEDNLIYYCPHLKSSPKIIGFDRTLPETVEQIKVNNKYKSDQT